MFPPVMDARIRVAEVFLEKIVILLKKFAF